MAIKIKTLFKTILFAFAGLMLIGTNAPSEANDLLLKKFQVKSGFLYHFALFIDWPDSAFSSPSAPLAVGIASDTNFDGAFDSLTSKTVKEHPVIVHTEPWKQTAAHPCHILLITSTDKKHIRAILDAVQGKSILTVGELDGFARMGGIINFYEVNNKLKFEINIDAARKAGLKISSHLLKLARIIRDES
ncbi:MAG: YfiR family protein [Deltaproteobacteria bacterium]|nr:YfiR family protein [Deltaproteobacteria bacterium]